ncbi:MAG TPA: deoxyribonuclease II family protein [Gammaproteobacteria bacterium]|jgi:hypothetical protein
MRASWSVGIALLVLPLVSVLAAPPGPLLSRGHSVDWWFVFKLNKTVFEGCEGNSQRTCPFGGTPQNYRGGQKFVYASSKDSKLQEGSDCAGDSTDDPIGATYDEIYNGSYNYVVWNDQFKGDPQISACGKGDCNGPWGHSKGILAWDDSGGVIMQVTTPSWPGSGSSKHPRTEDGNSLGCTTDNNIEYSQHFFALKLSKADVETVLKALVNASVATDPSNPQLVHVDKGDALEQLVNSLGRKSTSVTVLKSQLSTGVTVISKPSALHAPPWQLVSSELDGDDLLAATWWDGPYVPSTDAHTHIGCWPETLSAPGSVLIALSGNWDNKSFGLRAGANHAKIGASATSGKYAIFGDENQQGAISGSDRDCAKSQNGRGGLFFVLKEKGIAKSVLQLITGDTDPIGVIPEKKKGST